MNWSTEFHHLMLIFMAGALGGLVGLEREFQKKPAGLRTHIFVSAGAALLMIIGAAIIDSYEQQGSDLVESDPLRLVQAIVVGISFLGAGTILHEKDKGVEGLTTAASIFLTTGIGIATAVEEYILAGGTALFSLLTLMVVGRVEHRVAAKHKSSGDSDET
ncbi:MAG: MgtC/SapB family protein [Planctomycetaceae bacterium]|nr:MgtC/SapB family protein [Planctomycetaceae bacterium]